MATWGFPEVRFNQTSVSEFALSRLKARLESIRARQGTGTPPSEEDAPSEEDVPEEEEEPASSLPESKSEPTLRVASFKRGRYARASEEAFYQRMKGAPASVSPVSGTYNCYKFGQLCPRTGGPLKKLLGHSLRLSGQDVGLAEGPLADVAAGPAGGLGTMWGWRRSPVPVRDAFVSGKGVQPSRVFPGRVYSGLPLHMPPASQALGAELGELQRSTKVQVSGDGEVKSVVRYHPRMAVPSERPPRPLEGLRRPLKPLPSPPPDPAAPAAAPQAQAEAEAEARAELRVEASAELRVEARAEAAVEAAAEARAEAAAEAETGAGAGGTARGPPLGGLMKALKKSSLKSQTFGGPRHGPPPAPTPTPAPALAKSSSHDPRRPLPPSPVTVPRSQPPSQATPARAASIVQFPAPSQKLPSMRRHPPPLRACLSDGAVHGWSDEEDSPHTSHASADSEAPLSPAPTLSRVFQQRRLQALENAAFLQARARRNHAPAPDLGAFNGYRMLGASLPALHH